MRIEARVAKALAVICVRNILPEDIHAGTVPVIGPGTYGMPRSSTGTGGVN